MIQAVRLAVGTLAVLGCGFAGADEVFLKNGSHIVGTVKGVEDGKLLVETPFAGEIKISLDQVRGVETEAPTGVKLDSGEVISGTLTIKGEEQMLTGEGVERSVDPFALVAVGDPLELSAPPEANWSGRAEFGLTADTGNTERVDIKGRVNATRTAENDRLTLYLRGEYVTEDGDETKNEVVGGARYEHDITDRWFVFGRLELEFDEFEDLDLRTTVTGGFGYFVVNNDRHVFRLLGGLAYQHEEFDSGDSTDSLLAEFGYEYRLKLRKWLYYTSDFTYFLNLTDLEDWRFDAENAAEIPLSNTEAWKLRFGVRNEFDNDPEPGIDSLDTTYYTSLVYDWK